MGDPYTDVSVSSYNANPPSDDGSEVSTNEILWATVKSKLADPLNTAIASLNTNIGAAVDKLLSGAGVTSDGAGLSMSASHQGALIRQTANGITTTTPDATSVGSPFVFAIINDSGGDNTVDGNGSQTINGNASITLKDQEGAVFFTDGANWFAIGLFGIDANTLFADTTDNLTVGYTASPYDLGTGASSATVTPDPTDGNFQTLVNGGDFTLDPATLSGLAATIVVQITNNANAGTITTDGFDRVTGDAFTTTDGDDFMCVITVNNGFSVLNVTALQ